MFHVKHEAWAEDVERVGVPVSADQLEQLATYEQLLRRIAVPRGIIAQSDAQRLWDRHIVDGLRAAPEIPEGASVGDLGSGAGIPGIPLAVALPKCTFTLIEPRRSRLAFLEAAVEDLCLSNAQIAASRAENVRRSFAVCAARALSSPIRTWQMGAPLLAPGGVLIYWAGERFNRAILEAAGVRFRLSGRSGLAPTGPLVIMGPQ
jgi:16S rRNA (guanine527-N7)-methyltransferase